MRERGEAAGSEPASAGVIRGEARAEKECAKAGRCGREGARGSGRCAKKRSGTERRKHGEAKERNAEGMRSEERKPKNKMIVRLGHC